MHGRTIAGLAVVAALAGAPTFAQQAPETGQAQPPSATGQAGMQAQELYHVHFVKAAPGKIAELVGAYRETPVAEGEPGPPLIFRHLQGDDWDLLVLTPLGKEETVRTAATPEEQRSVERMRGLRAQHGDTFTAGPAWPEVRAALLGEGSERPTGTAGGSAGPIYTVSTYRSLPGHRDQLGQTLQRIAALYPDRRTILQHVEGAPWEFVVISRFDSWSALGEDQAAPAEKLRSQGFASNEAIGTELRQHLAEHRDTIARMESAPPGPAR